jgi:hypothetical protein
MGGRRYAGDGRHSSQRATHLVAAARILATSKVSADNVESQDGTFRRREPYSVQAHK